MTTQTVYIVDGVRTPYLKARNQPGQFSASDLAVAAGKNLLLRQPFAATAIEEIILGCVMPRETEANIARLVGLRLGCGVEKPAWTVQRNCGSGMQALDSAMKDIQLGRYDLVLAGGTEAMSRAPFLWQPELINWVSHFKFSNLSRFRLKFLKPINALLCGLTDPVVGLNMGQTAEILANQFNITRPQMDAFALRSHQRLAQAQDEGLLDLTPLFAADGTYYTADTGLRRDTSLEKLAALKPFFDPPYGLVTAGNSSQVTDGAALLILASEQAVKTYQLPVLGKIIDVEWAALSPEMMGLGPVKATIPLLQRHQLSLTDIDFWEINEAFAAQVLACLAYLEDQGFGKIDQDRLNVNGGAIALGHPVGASGARIVLQLLHVLRRHQAKRGVAAICIGGGQGGAMLIERE